MNNLSIEDVVLEKVKIAAKAMIDSEVIINNFFFIMCCFYVFYLVDRFSPQKEQHDMCIRIMALTNERSYSKRYN